MNSTVLVKVHNQKKSTPVKYNTDSPFYNEFYVFEFHCTLDSLLDKHITLTVIKPGSCLSKRKILGVSVLEIAMVWAQNNHQYYHKWVILTLAKKQGVRGYLKVDLSITAKGVVPIIPLISPNDEIEGNLLLPFKGSLTERQKANFFFDIHSGQNFKKGTDSGPPICVVVGFAGYKLKTSVKKNTSLPEWNERLVLEEMFPPLCQRIKFELYHVESCKKVLIAQHYIDFRAISNDKEEGFLPTFGPSLIHFYNDDGYVGSILASISVNILIDSLGDNKAKPSSVISSPIITLPAEQIYLSATIFDASQIKRKISDKQISFKMTFGEVLVQKSGESGDNSILNTTQSRKPQKTNRNYSYLDYNENKPYMSIILELLDVRKRIYHSNMLNQISYQLKLKIDKIEKGLKDYFDNTGLSNCREQITKALDFVTSTVTKYIDIASSYTMTEFTKLDQERLKMCVREMREILEISKSAYERSAKKAFQKLEKIHEKINSLVKEVQDCWPKVYLSMFYGTKRLSCCTFDATDIIYSPVVEEKGMKCGKVQTVYFNAKDKIGSVDYLDCFCKVDVLLWIGLDRHKEQDLYGIFSQGFRLEKKVLIAEEKHIFQCRAHIFQGRFTPGYDKSGLCDPFVHVIMQGQFRETEVIHHTLSPCWDQTLIFKNIPIYGSKEFIKTNRPIIFVEVYDKDLCGRNEVVGKGPFEIIFKLVDVPYTGPSFPPILRWYPLRNKFEISAEILAAFELLEISSNEQIEDEQAVALTPIPSDIKPRMEEYVFEVYFWGIRNMKACKPKIAIECNDWQITSEPTTKHLLNFNKPIIKVTKILPSQMEYAPPLSIKMYDLKSFGISVYSGIYTAPIRGFLWTPVTLDERKGLLAGPKADMISQGSADSFISIDLNRNKDNMQLLKVTEVRDDATLRICKKCFGKPFKSVAKQAGDFKQKVRDKGLQLLKKTKKDNSNETEEKPEDHEEEAFDWWTKFFASIERVVIPEDAPVPLPQKCKLKIYERELELQPEFNCFKDTLNSFPIFKGKRTGDELLDEEYITGIFKGALKIYKANLSGSDFVTTSGLPLEKGYFQDFPANQPLRYLLRIYCVRAIGLRAKDFGGKSDPYIYINLNGKIISDKKRYIKRQLNPIFGTCYEMEAVFPQDNLLIISVYDYDKTTADDFIGETKIDLENRFYSKHRAFCGIAENYHRTGYCEWRDQQKPTAILENLCKKYNLDGPEYSGTSVRVAYNHFPAKLSIEAPDKEALALAALRRWHEIPVVGCHLVPEHVETRSLYNPARPGLEQGKLQLWIDLFPYSDLPMPKQVDISPRKAAGYELRVIIWNTAKVKLDEGDFLSGGRKSDIFVKGWLTGPEDAQCTDVHYRSLAGEGNFNWRFVFPFDYLSTENKLVLYKKQSIFDIDETEIKLPCRLTLQVWDNDTFSADDFLGVLHLDLFRFPRGAQDAKNCTLAVLKPKAPMINIFKTKRTKGWWPFRAIKENQKEVLTGCVEVELELVTREEAKKRPAGLGREEPQALPMPKRPDTSFSWIANPLKSLKYLIKLHKWKMIRVLVCMLVIFILIGLFHKELMHLIGL